MPDTTSNLQMRNIIAGQADSVAAHNEALHILDTVTCLGVLDRGTNTPPAAAEGDAYIIGTSPTGDWVGREHFVAYYYGAQWNYIEPATGLMAWVEDESVMCRFTGSVWESKTGESIFDSRKTSSQTIAGGGTNITWNSDVRKDGIFTHSTSVSPEDITVTEAGDMEISFEVTIDYVSGTGWQKCQLEITVNGTQVAGSLVKGGVDSNIDQLTVSGRRLVSLAVNDVVRIKGTHTAGGGSIQALADSCRVHLTRK